MANRPFVFQLDTRLWNPGVGWRVFPAGETDPGAAWSEREGGDPIGASATAGALKDLIDANDRLDQMGDQLARKDHDLAVMAAERDAANDSVHDLEQRALAAEAGQKAAEDAASGYMKERDAARSGEQAAKDALAKPDEAHAAQVADLTEQLATANQTIADLNGQIETLTAPKKAAKADAASAEPAPAA